MVCRCKKSCTILLEVAQKWVEGYLLLQNMRHGICLRQHGTSKRGEIVTAGCFAWYGMQASPGSEEKWERWYRIEIIAEIKHSWRATSLFALSEQSALFTEFKYRCGIRNSMCDMEVFHLLYCCLLLRLIYAAMLDSYNFCRSGMRQVRSSALVCRLV